MPKLIGESFSLEMDDLGSNVVLEDRMSSARWILDETTRLVAQGIPRFGDLDAYSSDEPSENKSKVKRIGKGKAEKSEDNQITCLHPSEAGNVRLHWVMHEDRLQIIADPETDNAAPALSLPGTFRPEGETGFLSAVPNAQGVLHFGRGPAFYRPLFSNGHVPGFTMGMFGQISAKAGLLSIAETQFDAAIHWEKTEEGALNLMWQQHPSMETLSYPRETVLMPAKPSVASICRAYRKYVMEKGRFKNWDEKIAERPVLEKIFGGAMVFLGYHDDPEVDYLESLRELKSQGVQNGIICPAVLATSYWPKELVGADGIDLSQHTEQIKKLGFIPMSFSFLVDGNLQASTNPSEDFIHDVNGKPRMFWQIRDTQWHIYSSRKLKDEVARALEQKHQNLEGIHFDVLCSRPGNENYVPDGCGDARADVQSRMEVLKMAGNAGLAISSEGFWDCMTPYYDLGNSKYPMALGGEEYCIVPMTMLVFHDSAYHTWWECHNYNDYLGGVKGVYSDRFCMSGGRIRQQAMMDALMGTIPDLFPFGKQYGYVPQNHPEIYYFGYRLSDPVVQEAIRFAKPVMDLNRRIGKLEMVDHVMHRPDGGIQETVFSDGTRVVCNFANVALEGPDQEMVAPEAWYFKPS